MASCSQKNVASEPNVEREGQQNGPSPVLPTKPKPGTTPTPSSDPTPEPRPSPDPSVTSCTDSLFENVTTEFSVQLTGDAQFDSSETAYRFAVGGNAEMKRSEVGKALSPEKARVDLAVGGKLKGKKINAPNGQVRSVLDPDVKDLSALGGLVKGPSVEFEKFPSFYAGVVQECLKPKKNTQSWIVCQTVDELRTCRLAMEGKDPNVNVFEISADKITDGALRTPLTAITLSIPPASQAVIRVYGKTLKLGRISSTLPSNVDPWQVTWVFPQATEIKLFKSSFVGGLVAPNAIIGLDGVQWSGFLFAKGLNASNSEFFSPLGFP
jgi:choice-of-anchor A domain-containing protein